MLSQIGLSRPRRVFFPRNGLAEFEGTDEEDATGQFAKKPGVVAKLAVVIAKCCHNSAIVEEERCVAKAGCDCGTRRGVMVCVSDISARVVLSLIRSGLQDAV